jgi:hypothetical protein
MWSVVALRKSAMQRLLRCYAEGRPGAWEAVCLDFDIAVQGESLEQVFADLTKAIAMYLDYVRSLPAEEREALLKRKAPLALRWTFAWYALRFAFRSRGDNSGKGRAEFMLPCPA